MKKLKNLKNSKIFYILLLMIITMIQIILIIYAVSKREGYHIDEYYSHGLMSYKRAFIFDNDDFQNNWHNSEYFKDYITINENEKWNFSAVYNNQIEDVHPPLYYLLLRIACSFNINEFSIWPGTILNIILFILSNIMLYLIGIEIFKSKKYSLLLCLLNGLSIATIEIVMYVRMYQLLILETLMLIYWHLKNKDKALNIKNLILLYFILVAGGLTHYYFFIFMATLFIMYIIENIIKKNYKNILEYIITYILSALTIVLIFPYCINHMFFSYRGTAVISNANNFSLQIFLIKLMFNIPIINKEILNGYTLLILSIITLCFIVMLVIKYKKKIKIINKKNSNSKYILIPAFAYFILSISLSPYVDLRYNMPMVLLVLFVVFYILKYIIEGIVKEKYAFYLMSIFVLIFSIPMFQKLSNNSYTYKGMANINQYAENKPVVYIYNDNTAQYNKIMNIYNILLNSNETFILPDDEELTSEKIKEILQGKDTSNGIIFIILNSKSEILLDVIMDSNLFNNATKMYSINVYDIYNLK